MTINSPPRTSSATSTARSRLPLVVWVVAIGTFLMATSEFLVAGVLPEVAQDFRIEVGSAGLAITVFAVGMIIGSPAMVLLTIRVPRRTVLALLLIVFAIGHVVAALSTAFAVLLLARFVTALATGAFWAIAGQTAADAAGDGARTRALGVVGAGGMLANVIGVPLGSLAGQISGWRGPVWVLAALALIATAAVLRYVPHAHTDGNVSIRSEFAALRSGRLWLVLLTCSFATGGVLSLYSYVSPLLTNRTMLPERAVPLALILFGVAALIGTVVAGRLGDTHPYRAVLGGATVTLLALVGLALTSTIAIPTFALFTVVGLTGLSINPILGFLAMHFGGSAPTLANALTPSAFNVGTAVGTGATGALLGTAVSDFAPLLVALTAGALVLASSSALTLLHLATQDCSPLTRPTPISPHYRLKRKATDMAGTKVWFITGAARGLGVDLVKAALAAGHSVVATARDANKVTHAIGPHERLLAVPLDITDPDAARTAVEAALQQFGRIDVLVNNAGNFYAGFFENLSPEQFRAQIETNFFGPLTVTRAVLPAMRAERSGQVVTISSTAGLVGGEFTSAYAASKFALEGWMESLSPEVAPYGIATMTVEPGFFRTELLVEGSSTMWPELEIEDYADRTAQTIEAWKGMNGKQGGDPAKLAAALIQLVDSDEPPHRFIAGTDAMEGVLQHLATVEAQIDANRDLSASLAHED